VHDALALDGLRPAIGSTVRRERVIILLATISCLAAIAAAVAAFIALAGKAGSPIGRGGALHVQNPQISAAIHGYETCKRVRDVCALQESR
jgi:hypothetical protein